MKKTIAYYEKNASEYVAKTRLSDINGILSRFLKNIPKDGFILDLGCGSGRDSRYFIENGFRVEALDASESIARLAEKELKQNIRVMDFRELDYKKEFDGVWACASLLHLTLEAMESVLQRIFLSLKKDGYIYLSVKEGEFEGYIDGRYFTYYTKENIVQILGRNRFAVEEIWITEDALSSRSEKWINVIAKVQIV